MRLCLVTLLGFIVSSAMANPPPGRFPDPIPGLKAALQFCSQIQDDKMLINCIRIESGANWLTAEALPICSMQTFDTDRVKCLQGIIDNHIRPEEVEVCESLTFNDQKAQCLKDIARPFPYKTRFKVDPQPGRDEAATFCKSFFFDKDKKSCLNILSSADLITVEAVRFCQNQFSDRDKLDCMDRTKNRFIVPEEVLMCESVFSNSAKLTCLEGVQRKYQKIRP